LVKRIENTEHHPLFLQTDIFAKIGDLFKVENVVVEQT
jgi:hypothetical protein